MPPHILQHAFISVRVQPLAAIGPLRIPGSKNTKKKRPAVSTARLLLGLRKRARGTTNPLETGLAKDLSTTDNMLLLIARNKADPVIITPREGFIGSF